MKKEFLVAVSVLFGMAASLSVSAQEKLSLKQCREMALKYNKEMAAADKQTEAARLMSLSYKANFFPNFTASGTGLYSTADGSLGIQGGNLPVFLPDPATGELVTSGYAYFPGLNLDYKVGTVYTGGVQVEQPLYMGGKIRTAYKMSLLGKEMAHLNEELTASEVILNTDKAYVQLVKAKEMKKVAEKYHVLLNELFRNVKSAHQHGMKPQNDVLKVQVKLNESELALRKADNALRLAGMNLCHYIGRPLTAGIDISDEFPEVEQEWKTQVADISARPEYGILNKQRSAKVKLEQTRLEQENANEKMLLELTQATNNLDEARLECELSERSLEQAEENMKVSGKQYEVGLETLSDYLEAQVMWQQAYQTKVDAHFQLYVNYVAYLKAAGQLQ